MAWNAKVASYTKDALLPICSKYNYDFVIKPKSSLETMSNELLGLLAFVFRVGGVTRRWWDSVAGV